MIASASKEAIKGHSALSAWLSLWLVPMIEVFVVQGNRAYLAFNLFGCFLSAELLTYCFILVKFLASSPSTGSAVSHGTMPIAAFIAVLSMIWLLPVALLTFTNCLLASDSIEEAEFFYSLLLPVIRTRIYPRNMLLECQAGLADCLFARKDFKAARNRYRELLEEYGTEFSARFSIVLKKYELTHEELETKKAKAQFSRSQLRELMVVETATVALACLALLYIVQSVPDFDDVPKKQLSSKTVWHGLQ